MRITYYMLFLNPRLSLNIFLFRKVYRKKIELRTSHTYWNILNLMAVLHIPYLTLSLMIELVFILLIMTHEHQPTHLKRNVHVYVWSKLTFLASLWFTYVAYVVWNETLRTWLPWCDVSFVCLAVECCSKDVQLYVQLFRSLWSKLEYLSFQLHRELQICRTGIPNSHVINTWRAWLSRPAPHFVWSGSHISMYQQRPKFLKLSFTLTLIKYYRDWEKCWIYRGGTVRTEHPRRRRRTRTCRRTGRRCPARDGPRRSLSPVRAPPTRRYTTPSCPHIWTFTARTPLLIVCIYLSLCNSCVRSFLSQIWSKNYTLNVDIWSLHTDLLVIDDDLYPTYPFWLSSP